MEKSINQEPEPPKRETSVINKRYFEEFLNNDQSFKNLEYFAKSKLYIHNTEQLNDLVNSSIANAHNALCFGNPKKELLSAGCVFGYVKKCMRNEHTKEFKQKDKRIATVELEEQHLSLLQTQEFINLHEALLSLSKEYCTFSPKEKEIAELYLKGLSNKEIVEITKTTKANITNHIGRINQKLFKQIPRPILLELREELITNTNDGFPYARP